MAQKCHTMLMIDHFHSEPVIISLMHTMRLDLRRWF